ncbi:uncharacterized protein LOC119076760 [Bradysia coprophila]|uniref:uncharacterized protein LOC119076760 n=1 Tax=Bradysia coprophila TaxID=38358 RepID=UPI00187DBE93|nr:uncharacterized protein LOC119076760 [Bradysia coprophila]
MNREANNENQGANNMNHLTNQGSSNDAIIGTAQSGPPDALEITEKMSNKSEHNSIRKFEMDGICCMLMSGGALITPPQMMEDDGEIEKLKHRVYKALQTQFVVEDREQFKMVKTARETVEQYKERKLSEMREAGDGQLIGSNPNMRRNIRGSNAPEATASEELRKYTENRMKNNVSAKKSRDKRKLRDIVNGFTIKYYREDSEARQNEMRDVDAMIRKKKMELILKAARIMEAVRVPC